MIVVAVQEYSVPSAGVDSVDIVLEEEYEVEGLGRDIVRLEGLLVADRAAPLLERGSTTVDWETSTVVARFTSLDVRGSSETFGAVRVILDPGTPSFGLVRGGDCKATLSVIVSMPDHDLTLKTAEPVQLQSQVSTVPPIGDERTISVGAVQLVDLTTQRSLGSLQSARVMWRELVAQISHERPVGNTGQAT